jgi:hypothetical protein
MLLYPFSTHQFTLLKHVFEPNSFSGYFFSPYFALELFIVALAFVSLARRFYKNRMG